MSDLYWITILGNISSISTVISFISGFILLVSLFFIPVTSDCCCEETIYFIKKSFKVSVITFSISLLISIFAPSTKEAYIIYGAGSVIDYAKNSKEIQKLPDNAIKALNKYLEEVDNNSIK